MKQEALTTPVGIRRLVWLMTLGFGGMGCYLPPAEPTVQGPPVISAQTTAIAGTGGGAPLAPAGTPAAGISQSAGAATPASAGAPIGGAAPIASVPQAGAAAPAAPGPAAGSAPACSLPACISDLVARCPPMGECSMTPFGNGPLTTCFANGIKVKTNIMFGTDLSIMGQTLNPDGSTCYAFDGMSAGDGINLTWRDATGNVAATGTANMATMALSVTCTGATMPVTLDMSTCGGMGMMMPGMMMRPMCMGTAPCM